MSRVGNSYNLVARNTWHQFVHMNISMIMSRICCLLAHDKVAVSNCPVESEYEVSVLKGQAIFYLLNELKCFLQNVLQIFCK